MGTLSSCSRPGYSALYRMECVPSNSVVRVVLRLYVGIYQAHNNCLQKQLSLYYSKETETEKRFDLLEFFIIFCAPPTKNRTVAKFDQDVMHSLLFCATHYKGT